MSYKLNSSSSSIKLIKKLSTKSLTKYKKSSTKSKKSSTKSKKSSTKSYSIFGIF